MLKFYKAKTGTYLYILTSNLLYNFVVDNNNC